MPALVPGMVDAGLVALREFGTKSFNEVIAPAIELADGFAIDEMRANSIAGSRRFFDLWPTSKAHFMPNGQLPRVGEIFRQPDLARTLRAMAEAEKKALAAGAQQAGGDRRGARLISIAAKSRARSTRSAKPTAACCAMRTWPRSSWSRKSRCPPPITAYHVYKPGFWSQGPAMIETLNIMEGFDQTGAPLNSAEYIHRSVEAMKLAYADRDTYYGDPKFNQIPTDVLLSKEYAAERRKHDHGEGVAGISARQDQRQDRASIPPKSRWRSIKIDDELMAHDTTCVDAIDKDGMVFSATPSGAWLPSVIAGDTGIPLTERAPAVRAGARAIRTSWPAASGRA